MVFTVTVQIKEDGENTVEYTSVDDCLSDVWMKHLFDGGFVKECMVTCLGDRISALPPALVSWERFQEQLVSNQATLDRKGRYHG